MHDLRPHQVKAIDMLVAAFRAGKRRPIIQAPCGFGKTLCAARIVIGARAKGNRVVFCVPSLSLIQQTFDRFVENGIDPGDMGIIQANHAWTRPHAGIQIASVQTLQRREFPLTDIVICDEVHLVYDVICRWQDEQPDKLFIGLSATPFSRGLAQRWDCLLKPTSMADMIAQGWLSKFKVFAPSHPDLSGVKTVAGDYQEDQLGEAMSKPKLVADVVETWCARAEGRPTIVFAVNRAHARLIHDQFEKSLVPVAYIDANTEREEREAIGRRLANREIQVVVNIGTLIVGVDWDVRCISFARPTKSEMLYIQAIGRGLRPVYPKGFDPQSCTDEERAAACESEKGSLLLLDHSDTTMRLGMVDEIDHDELLGGKKPKSESEPEEKHIGLPHECEDCGCLVPPKATECPNCGHVNRRRVNVEQLPGQLEEFQRGGKRVKAPSVKDALIAMGKAEVWAQIKGMSEQYNWSKGRRSHVYRDIFGVWPGYAIEDLPAKLPSSELLGWERSKRIAYARSMRAKERAAG